MRRDIFPRVRDLVLGSEMDKRGSGRRTHPLSRELMRYVVVGGCASLVDVGLLVGLTTVGGMYYLHAATLALSGGLLTSYLGSVAWVFQERTWRNPLVEAALFTLIGGIGLLGNGVVMWGLTEYAHWHYLCAKMVAALVVFCWNFFAKKYLVFHQSPRRQPSGARRQRWPEV